MKRSIMGAIKLRGFTEGCHHTAKRFGISNQIAMYRGG